MVNRSGIVCRDMLCLFQPWFRRQMTILREKLQNADSCCCVNIIINYNKQIVNNMIVTILMDLFEEICILGDPETDDHHCWDSRVLPVLMILSQYG